jgi:hypothetical protein
MTTPPQTQKVRTSLTQDLSRALQHYLGGRRGFLILAGIAIVAGLAFNWSWLVAAGIAPLLIGALPCVAVCAVGACCMNKMANRPDPTDAADKKPPEIESGNQD